MAEIYNEQCHMYMWDMVRHGTRNKWKEQTLSKNTKNYDALKTVKFSKCYIKANEYTQIVI